MGRKHFFLKVKKIFRDWDIKVMTYVMLVVTAVSVMTATVAWFSVHAAVNMEQIEIQAASTETIKVAIEEGGEDVEVLRKEDENTLVSVNMPTFSNVTGEGLMAPGTYGIIKLYVTPLNESVTGCEIVPADVGNWTITYVDESVSAAEKEVLQNLLRGHLLFFGVRTKTDGNYTYSNHFSAKKPLQVDLEWDVENDIGVEKEVTIYWWWPYEYTEIPAEITDYIGTENGHLYPREYFFEAERETSGYEDNRLYDYADTRIGMGIVELQMSFEVTGSYGESSQ